MKTIMFLLLAASTATCLAGDVITVNVHGPATESLWRNAGHPWQSTIGGAFKPNVGELVPAWTFDLRPGGANWYSSHTLTDAEDVAALMDIHVGEAVGPSQLFDYGRGPISLPIYSIPEPSAALLALLAIGGIGSMRRR